MHRPLFWTVILVGGLAALVPLGLGELIVNTAQSVVLTILTLMWSLFLIRVARLVLTALSQNQEGAPLVQT